jgi:hypothetical protein
MDCLSFGTVWYPAMLLACASESVVAMQNQKVELSSDTVTQHIRWLQYAMFFFIPYQIIFEHILAVFS